jgi:uncharacterized membrane protein
MIDSAVTALAFAAAIASALVAGIFYAFSSFVMPALGRIDARSGVDAMNAINVTVITPSFLALFVGTALACAALGLWSLFWWSEPGAGAILAASLFYLFGCFGVTMVCNVPLNDRLAASKADDGDAFWRLYLRVWTRWNTVRTVAPAVSAMLFVWALVQRHAV